MTMNVQVMSARDVDRHRVIGSLNACFANWGGDDVFAWAFDRDDGSRPADFLLIEEDGVYVAGCALVYRSVRLASGERVTAAIISAAFTLPQARRRGAFAQIIQTAGRVAEPQHAFVSGFVHADNGSRFAVEAAGFRLDPAWYCSAPAQDDAPQESAIAVAAPSQFERYGTTFVYSDREWRSQFLERPGRTVECVAGNDWTALVARSAKVDDVLTIAAAEDDAFVRAMTTLRRTTAPRLFYYTSLATRAESLRRAGFETSPGVVISRPPAGARNWNIESGDRM